MSDKPIQPGDLVMMVRGHSCLLKAWAGIPFVVAEIVQPRGGGWTCGRCNARGVAGDEPAATGFKPRGKVPEGDTPGVPLSWLVRIDPPTQSESVERAEEMT